jgi:hypothetical protein
LIDHLQEAPRLALFHVDGQQAVFAADLTPLNV